jgi:integrase
MGINIQELEEFKKYKKEKDKIILGQNNIINNLSLINKNYEENSKIAYEALAKIIKQSEPLSYDFIINNSMWSQKTKKNSLNLFKKYEYWCLERNINKMKSKEAEDNFDPLDYSDLYSPDNAFYFCTKIQNYSGTSTINRLQFFLRIIRKCTRNKNLEYSTFIGKQPEAKLKHVITKEEMLNFLQYLLKKNYILVTLMIELLYKFSVRIGALINLRKGSLSNDNIIFFKEKNSKVVKRRLLPQTAEKLRIIMKIQSLEEEDFIFYPHIHPFDKIKRDSFITLKINNIIKNSNCFNHSREETISSHMFRVTNAVEIYMQKGTEAARLELTHSKSKTTEKNYIQMERRNLHINQEKKFIKESIEKQKKKPKNLLKNKHNNIKESLDEENSLSESESDISITDESESESEEENINKYFRTNFFQLQKLIDSDPKDYFNNDDFIKKGRKAIEIINNKDIQEFNEIFKRKKRNRSIESEDFNNNRFEIIYGKNKKELIKFIKSNNKNE